MTSNEILSSITRPHALILSIHCNAQFIPDFQCLLQAFRLCVSWQHLKPEALAVVGLFLLVKEKKIK